VKQKHAHNEHTQDEAPQARASTDSATSVEEGLDSKVVVYDVESNLGICFARKLENSMEYMRRQMVEK